MPVSSIAILRGYPIAAVLGGTIILLGALGLVRQARSAQRGWDDDAIPIIVKPGRYDAVAGEVESALREAGLDVRCEPAPRSVDLPPRLLVAVEGARSDAMPDRLVQFSADDLNVVLSPSSVLIVGKSDLVARARAAVGRRLAFVEAYLTTAKESEDLEDRLKVISHHRRVAASDFRPIDDLLTRLPIPYDDWQTLYRLRLQVEHEGRLPGATGPADGS